MSDTAVAAIVLLRNDGAALMQHRDDKPGLSHAGLWVPPGGHSEPDESMEECARREFLEETGYSLDELHLLTDFIDTNAPGFAPLRLVVYWSRYDGMQDIVCLEGQALEFIPRERAGDYPIPPYLLAVWDQALDAAQMTVSR